MEKIYYYDITKFDEYEIDTDKDIFEQILNIKKDTSNPYIFYLRYINSTIKKYIENSDIYSFADLRDLYTTKIACCNLTPSLENDFDESGIKLIDPLELIRGHIDIRNHIMTYSPVKHPSLLQKSDLKETYYTTIRFEELLKNQIEYATSFYKIIGKEQDNYIKEETSKEKMKKLLR